MKRLILIAILVLLASPIAFAQDFCEGLADYDRDVDGTDAAIFKENFGRSPFQDPCPPDGPAPVGRTGQTASYHPFTGEDGDLQRGVPWPNPRFTDNGNGTVKDNLTGLIWLKNANCWGLKPWDEAVIVSHELTTGFCGLTDGSSGGQWRLPNLFELESLRDMRYWQPALSNSTGAGQWTHGDPFTNL